MHSSNYGCTSEISRWEDPALVGFQRSWWLRAFIHYFGDMHQPLHAATGCSAAHPEGDFGGNAEQFSTLAFLPLFEGQKVIFFPLSSGKNINEIRLSRELGK